MAALLLAITSGCPRDTRSSSVDDTAYWPRFRGPGGSGVCPYAGIPTVWDGASGEGIFWRARVPLPGNSSPIIWGDRIFVTGADESRRELYCFDRHTGRLLWTGKVATGSKDTPDAPAMTGFAAPTPATDGTHICALFANGDVGCLDSLGRCLWARNLGSPVNVYGQASSLLIHRDTLIVLLDQGLQEEGLSKLLALDVATGETRWEAKRPVAASWGTPIVIGTGNREELIACAQPWVMAYDPGSGAELWRAGCIRDDVAPSPVYAGGLLFTVNIRSCLAAIRPGGTGDVTATHVLWTSEENLPSICSPVSDGALVFLLTTDGLLTCQDAANGAKLWEHDFATECHASPGIAGGRLYVTTCAGTTHMLRVGRRCEVLGKAELAEPVNASLAFAPGRVYVRGEGSLWCLGEE